MSILLLKPFTSPRHCLIFAGVAMVVMAVVQWLYPNSPQFVLFPDSIHYIEFHPFRNALYPAFLDLFGDDTLTNNQPALALIGITQTTIYIGATGFMLWALAITRLPIIVLVLFLLANGVNFTAQLLHQSILAESLGLSMVACLIATLALWFHTKRYRWLAAAMLVATISFGLRPNALPFVLGVALVALFHIASTRHWRKPLLAVLVPFILVAGLESAYFHAHHASRSHELLHRHMLGKAIIVLAAHEVEGQNDRFYQAEFAPLKTFMPYYSEVAHTDLQRYWANGEVCAWLVIYGFYESEMYGHKDFPQDLNWSAQVFATYPATFARITAQHYLKFFCVVARYTAKTPILTNDILGIDPNWISIPRHPLMRFALQLMGWGFIGLGIAFFASKIWYGYRWLRRALALVSSRFIPPSLTPHEALGSTLIMLAFGYNLFIAIFTNPGPRFLAISYPLIVLGILLMATIIAQHPLPKK